MRRYNAARLADRLDLGGCSPSPLSMFVLPDPAAGAPTFQLTISVAPPYAIIGTSDGTSRLGVLCTHIKVLW